MFKTPVINLLTPKITKKPISIKLAHHNGCISHAISCYLYANKFSKQK